ncbi:MAG: TDP-N-acetylfucosamine:lipid II N-acetylfucosaminyltransferase, partial [Sphingobacterium sp.]
KKGYDLFGDCFTPLTSFLSRDAYLSVIKDCSVGIFYHYRQQARGNIIAMLYFGARIYLSSRNPVFNFLKDNSIYVYDFDLEFNIYLNQPLDSKLIAHNRFWLEQVFSEKKNSLIY